MELTTTFTADFVAADSRIPLPVQLVYKTEDPYAVTMIIHNGLAEPITWVFSRDFLLPGDHNDGCDVRSWTGGDEDLHIVLSSPFGTAEFILPTTQLVLFRRDMFKLVPDGFEADHLDLDATLTELLKKG